MSDGKKYSYSNFIDQIILAIEAGDEDDEMKWRADFQSNFRLSDEQINAALFKQFSRSKISKKKPANSWIDLSKVEPLSYLMDGWLLKGDVCLTYGCYGSGKTTFALWLAYKYALGENILDRNVPCEKGKTLFICTDGGVNTFKKALKS
jgi:RecA-family ATPase